MLLRSINAFIHCSAFKFCFLRNGCKSGDGPVDLVLSCVDNFEARMAVNMVSLQCFPLIKVISKHAFHSDILCRPATNWAKRGSRLE